MSVKLLTESHLGFLGLKGGCEGPSGSALARVPHCWKTHGTAQVCSSIISQRGTWNRAGI